MQENAGTDARSPYELRQNVVNGLCLFLLWEQEVPGSNPGAPTGLKHTSDGTRLGKNKKRLDTKVSSVFFHELERVDLNWLTPERALPLTIVPRFLRTWWARSGPAASAWTNRHQPIRTKNRPLPEGVFL